MVNQPPVDRPPIAQRRSVTLVIGGARSGKSAIAERIVARAAGADAVTYLATAVIDPGDDDFAARVAIHRDRRPAGWLTLDVGPSLAEALTGVEGPVLVDSLGTWVAAHEDLEVDVEALASALAVRTAPTVVVAEEVGGGLHPTTAVGRRFRDVLGTVNQAVAEVADDVWLVVAGRVLPLQRWNDVTGWDAS